MGKEFRRVCQQIEGVYEGLSPQLKLAARRALDHPDDVALLSMRQFAAKATVHPSTMTRLVKVLGVDGYGAFQKPFQARLRTRPEEPFSTSAHAIQARGLSKPQALFNEMLSMEQANLLSLSDDIGYEALSKCAAAITKARRVYVGGVRSCYPAAYHFKYSCRMFKDNVTLLDGHGSVLADELRSATSDDVLLAISFSPYSRDMVNAVDFASSRGVKIIALTDSVLSPLLKYEGAIPLVVRTTTPSFFHSMAPAMVAVQTLVLLLIANGGKEALGALSETEAQLNAIDAYWSNDVHDTFRRE